MITFGEAVLHDIVRDLEAIDDELARYGARPATGPAMGQVRTRIRRALRRAYPRHAQLEALFKNPGDLAGEVEQAKRIAARVLERALRLVRGPAPDPGLMQSQAKEFETALQEASRFLQQQPQTTGIVRAPDPSVQLPPGAFTGTGPSVLLALAVIFDLVHGWLRRRGNEDE